jgi:valyl-tRNA synthetase
VTLPDVEFWLEDRWVLGRLCATIQDCNLDMERRRLNDAAYKVFNFFRHELCDWYLETIKPRLRDEALRPAALLVAVLNLALSYKLLHPVMPFITEELWSWLPPGRGFLMVSPFPTFTGQTPFIEAQTRFEQVKEIVGVARNLRNELGVPPGKRGRIVLRVREPDLREALVADADHVALLAKLTAVEIVEGGPDPSPAGVGVAGQVEVFLPMEGLVDIDRERERLTKELGKVEGWIKGCLAKLENESFLANAPAAVVAKQRELLSENRAKAEKLEQRLQALT